MGNGYALPVVEALGSKPCELPMTVIPNIGGWKFFGSRDLKSLSLFKSIPSRSGMDIIALLPIPGNVEPPIISFN
jgi:hypothetical protein